MFGYKEDSALRKSFGLKHLDSSAFNVLPIKEVVLKNFVAEGD